MSFSSKLTKPELKFPTYESDEECNIESLDNQIALITKQFKKISKFRNKVENKQGNSNYPTPSNHRPHEKNHEKITRTLILDLIETLRRLNAIDVVNWGTLHKTVELI